MSNCKADRYDLWCDYCSCHPSECPHKSELVVANSSQALNTIIVCLILLAIAVICLACYIVPANILLAIALSCAFLALVGWFIMKVSR